MATSVKQGLSQQDMAVRKALRVAVRDTLTDIETPVKSALANWSNKPRFSAKIKVTPSLITGEIEVGGSARKKFMWIELGTGKYGPKKAAYRIPKNPVPGRLLRFQLGYSAKTAPIARGNVGSGKATGAWISKATVIHPGIKARKFFEHNAQELQPSFEERVRLAIIRAVK